MPDDDNRPKAGSVEERTAPVEAEDKQIRGCVPYDVEADLGDFRETIGRGALADTDFSQLRATIDHADRGLPLARYPGTLSIEHKDDGLHWAFRPPKSRPDLIEAVERGDVTGSSWRMRVAEDRWNGDHRTITRIGELLDITIAGSQQAAYPTAIEYRTTSVENNGGERRQEGGGAMPTDQDGAATEQRTENENESGEEQAEDRSTEERGGGLQVEDRVSAPRRGSLADEFRSRGWPQERAEITFDEFRAATIAAGSSLDDLAPRRQTGVGLGFDERTVYGVLPQVSVDASATSVDVVRQSGRDLASAEDVVRDLAATTSKPETDSEVEIVAESLKQVASISSGIPNVYLESSAVASVIENDLRLAVNEGLDKLVLDELELAANIPPGSDPLLVSIRRGVTAVQNEGYSPNVVILDPSDAEALDVEVTEAGTQDYIFGPGRSAPGTLFGLQVRVSKSTPNPVVADAAAVGRLYASPVSLQRFEESAGATNSSAIRLELSALFGVERLAAAVRIAAND